MQNSSLRRGRDIAVPILNLGAKMGGWSTPYPVHFTSQKATFHPLYRRLDGS